MLTFHFAAEDLLRTRFAISPLDELGRAVRIAVSPEPPLAHAAWARGARELIGDLDVECFAAILTSGPYTPDFLAPPPRVQVPDVGVELERVRGTPSRTVARELGWCFPRRLPDAVRPLVEDPRRALHALVDVMTELWDRLLAADWPRIRAVLEADIAYRARALTAGGPLEVFGDLHRDVRWQDGALLVARPYAQTVELDGRGLLLIPVAFSSEPATMFDPPWQPAVMYPPRGAGTLWAPSAARDSAALAQLIGPGRARLLSALDSPAATIDLAEQLELSAAGVSEHLGVLLRAGLVDRRRAGRRVLYARTPMGDALLDARRTADPAGSGPSPYPR